MAGVWEWPGKRLEPCRVRAPYHPRDGSPLLLSAMPAVVWSAAQVLAFRRVASLKIPW